MTRLALTAALMLSLCGGAWAQQPPAPTTPGSPWQMPPANQPPGDQTRPYELPGSEPGPLDNFFNDLIRRAQPHLEGLARDMTGMMEEYRPTFQELSRLIDDLGNYELPPERLPNGDIIIRRKADAPPPPPLDDLPRLVPRQDGPPVTPHVAPPAGGEIEL